MSTLAITSFINTGLLNNVGVAIDSNFMYITSISTNSITRVNLTNSTVTTNWATSTQGVDGTYGISISNGFIYGVRRNTSLQQIFKISIANPSGVNTQPNWRTGTLSANYYANATHITAGYLYVGFVNSGATASIISRISLTDPVNDYISSWATTPTGIHIQTIVSYNGDLYIGVQNSGIHKISISGTNQVVSATNLWKATGAYSIYGLTVYGTYLYGSLQSANTIFRVNLTNVSDASMAYATTANTAILNSACGVGAYESGLYIVSYSNSVVARTTVDLPPVIPVICFKEDSRILTNTGYRKIQHLKRGDLVKTFRHGFVPVFMVGKKDIVHSPTLERSKNHLYKCTPEHYPELADDLVLTGCHSILVDDYVDEEQLDKTIQVNGDVYVTEGKYRLPVCADKRATIYERAGKYTVYHVALENDDYYMNYGIYANGLLVESTSKRFLEKMNIMKSL